MPEWHVLIPARYAATRFPGKLLAPLAGKPILQHVFERVQASSAASVAVITDDVRIQKVAQSFGATVFLSQEEHASGTSRISEVVRRCPEAFGGPNAWVVNVQGDEPFVSLHHLLALHALMAHSHADVLTLCCPETNAEQWKSPHTVKVVRNHQGQALYFSRAPLPYGSQQGLRHLGLYAYRPSFLASCPELPCSPLAQAENLEQLQWLEAGHTVHCEWVAEQGPKGIDTPEDLKAAEAFCGASTALSGF